MDAICGAIDQEWIQLHNSLQPEGGIGGDRWLECRPGEGHSSRGEFLNEFSRDVCDFDADILGIGHWGIKVEVLEVDGAEARTFTREHTVCVCVTETPVGVGRLQY